MGAFAATVLLIELTPGPNMAWLATLAVARGRRAGLLAVLGVALGLGAQVVLVSAGAARLLAEAPAVLVVLRWLGAAYLGWLAIEAWRAAETSAARVGRTGDARLVMDGLVTNLLNVKSLLFLLAVPTAFGPGTGGAAGWAGLGAVYVGIATLVHAGVVLLAGRLAPWLTRQGRTRTVRRVLAVALALVALWLGWSTLHG